ncbi:hypothetical protein Tco_0070152 [Tanacetum coccineum]
MMLILRGRIVQSGRRHQSMKLMYLESRHLDKFFKRNKLHQLQEIKSKMIILIFGLTLIEGPLKLKGSLQPIKDDSQDIANYDIVYDLLSLCIFCIHHCSNYAKGMECDLLNTTGLFNKKVSDGANTNMIKLVTNAEIKTTMFNIGDEKALGPNGYTSTFFKKGWDVIG